MRILKKNIILEKNLLYFDYTASGLGYKKIESKLLEILKTYANTHSEVASNSIKTSQYYNSARENLHKSLEVDERFYILPCGTGSTGAIKKFQELLGLFIPPMTRKRVEKLNPNLPLVLIGPYEHHSNEVSLREALCELVRIPFNKEGEIDIEALKNILEKNKNREIIASFSVASNVTGVLTDYKTIYKIIKSYGGIIAFDAAAASSHMNINCDYYDALFLSPHKLLGGIGSCGLLVIKKDLVDDIKTPSFAGGGTVTYVSKTSAKYSLSFTQREDAGTPGILQFIKASLAYELRDEIGLKNIQDKEAKLKNYFIKKMKAIKNIETYCAHNLHKLPIFSLNIKDINPYKVALILSEKYGIQTRAGCGCAGPYGHYLLKLDDDQNFSEKPGWLRISLHYTHTKKDIDTLFVALIDISKNALQKAKEE